MTDTSTRSTTTGPRTSRAPVRDTACTAAVDLAQAAAAEVAGPGELGAHIGSVVEGDRLVTHLFTAQLPGYHGWRWAVTVTRAPRARAVTVNEVVMLPGADARLAPEWLPWSERIRPGDLGVGDLLPTQERDPRLAPGYTGAGTDFDELTDPASGGSALIGYELGLGRARVLSREGRDEASDRWYTGSNGPDDPVARAAPASCSTCGFFQPLAGALGHVFGVCANEMSPSDGAVVSADHGCGGHSEAVVMPSSTGAAPAATVLDESGYDMLTGTERGHSAGSVDVSAVEELGHS